MTGPEIRGLSAMMGSMTRLKSRWGWAAIAAFAVVWDNLCSDDETLSAGFWRASRRWALPAWGVLTAHLIFRTPLPIRWIKIR